MLQEPARIATRRTKENLRTDEDEVIDGPEEVTFILHAPGYWDEDLVVVLVGKELVVRRPDFAIGRQLPVNAEVSDIVRNCTNGVLNV